eukprot:1410163-Pyramimonas_sp.AAC.1
MHCGESALGESLRRNDHWTGRSKSSTWVVVGACGKTCITYMLTAVSRPSFPGPTGTIGHRIAL